MARENTDGESDTTRQEYQERLLKAALARPGVQEVMKVYGGWREKDSAFQEYGSSTTGTGRFTTSNSSIAP